MFPFNKRSILKYNYLHLRLTSIASNTGSITKTDQCEDDYRMNIRFDEGWKKHPFLCRNKGRMTFRFSL